MVVPYRDLYVYEISGEISAAREFFKKHFIGCWNEGEVSFLFFSRPHDKEVEAFADHRGLQLLSRNFLDYKAWQAGEELRPLKIENLVFSPPWENVVIGKEKTLVHIDPCVVFGTGYHPTTRSCLKALREVTERERPGKVLDLGTGSGILALAAAKWGAKKVLAIDCNELAVETALRNVTLNGEWEQIEVRQGKAEDFVDEEADLVCANLHLRVIDSLLRKEALFKKRWLILSGLFHRDGQEVANRLEQRAVTIFQRFEEKNWITLTGFNKNVPRD